MTHEHYDHLGGIADSAHYASLGTKLKLTAAQRRQPRIAGVGRDLAGAAAYDAGAE